MATNNMRLKSPVSKILARLGLVGGVQISPVMIGINLVPFSSLPCEEVVLTIGGIARESGAACRLIPILRKGGLND